MIVNDEAVEIRKSFAKFRRLSLIITYDTASKTRELHPQTLSGFPLVHLDGCRALD